MEGRRRICFDWTRFGEVLHVARVRCMEDGRAGEAESREAAPGEGAVGGCECIQHPEVTVESILMIFFDFDCTMCYDPSFSRAYLQDSATQEKHHYGEAFEREDRGAGFAGD